ncbi:MAG: transcription antitermination factor NusB [Bacteroidetes bacterium]|nr:MAG: transcription antitermination factor NusB [Bacteroidota bacterium]RLD74092.1 MAG: transcription antitermination factor NusB [Bacteroidota bacterium]RLD87853.1 MAG: transcription antitermination factor NusB [Bacteroidota bacterium]
MLYRRHLRIKVLQSLYSWYTGGQSELPKAERELLDGIDKLYELFIYQLSFVLEVKKFAEERLEQNKKKFYPTEEDLNPNLKFVQNPVFKVLETNKSFHRLVASYKINWSDEEEMIRKFYAELRKTNFYKKYMSSVTSSFDEDKKFMIQMTDQLLSEFESLRFFYEEKSIYFVDGYDLVLLLLIKFFETASPRFTEDTPMPGIYKEYKEKNEDLDFVKVLFRKTILGDDESTEIIKSKTKNWEYDRIPLMDIILLKMAINELQEMETIPLKVTLNEYIELAKYFSTANSKVFVNGVLDKLIGEFKSEGKINKSGRGLKE